MRPAFQVNVIKSFIDLLEERKSQLETNLTLVNTMIGKCKTWIEGTDNNETSFKDLCSLCLCFEGDVNSNDSDLETATQVSQGDEPRDIPYSNSVIENMIKRIEKLESKETSNTFNESLKISETARKVDMESNTLTEIQRQLEKKTFSKEMKEMVTRIETDVKNHNDLIKHLSCCLDESKQLMLKLREDFQSNMKAITDDMTSLKDNVHLNQPNNEKFKNLANPETAKDRNDVLQKRFGLMFTLAANKIEAIKTTCAELNIQNANNKKLIEKFTSALATISLRAENKRVNFIANLAGLMNIPTRQGDELIHLVSVYSDNTTLVPSNLNSQRAYGMFTVVSNGLYHFDLRVESHPHDFGTYDQCIFAKVFNVNYLLEFKPLLTLPRAVNCNVNVFLNKGDNICLYRKGAKHGSFVFYGQLTCEKIQ